MLIINNDIQMMRQFQEQYIEVKSMRKVPIKVYTARQMEQLGGYQSVAASKENQI